MDEQCCGTCGYTSPRRILGDECVVCEHPLFTEMRAYEVSKQLSLPSSVQIVTDDYMNNDEGTACPCWQRKEEDNG